MANLLWKTLGAGALAGLRSMTPLATLSSSLAKHNSANLAASPLRFLQSKAAATGLKLLAGGEMVADKIPGMPNRTNPTALLGRALSGALIGATMYKAGKNRQVAVGAALGSVAAVAATFASFHLRKSLGKQTQVPDTAWALAEDAATLGSSLAVAKAPKEARPRFGRYAWPRYGQRGFWG
ncbi:Uncharacterized membrane protein [Hymenobacter daecheongensis DSM 21074]|uniref:Uncharacterized membrane protein n=1 Tax=Hymenobacter daecheongensis DSM 21074 TaxID=1121955 RepID=A0A1M6MEV3_9BACT|nr:DUF4126 family protein [Hymenobacter daecheongensis]SHJ82042.1 Uncharacterized membrane protein [Hymenobacter daecheongensis DSM 21074]